MEKRLRENLPNGEFKDVSRKRSKHMAAVKGKGNRSTELRLRLGLVRTGVRGWTLHPASVRGRPDFHFPDKRLAVFVDGCFWHGCGKCGHVPKKRRAFWEAKIEGNKKRDRQVTKRLKREGMVVIRFWEHELAENLGKYVERVRDAVGKSANDGRA